MRHLTSRLAVVTLVVLVACSASTTDAPPPGPSSSPSIAVGGATTTSTEPASTTTTLLPGADPVLGIVPPEPTDYPFIEYSYRFNEYLATCSAEAGYEFKLTGGAAPSLSFRGSVTPRRTEVIGRCEEIARERGWVIPNPFDGSPEANAILYDIYVDIYNCMVERGYPTTEPPSREAFTAEGESLWTPWEEMFGSVLYVDPESDWGPTGTMPPDQRLQYQAQEICGGSPNEVYDQQLQEQG